MADRIRKMVLDVLFACKEQPLERQTTDVLQFVGEVASHDPGGINPAKRNHLYESRVILTETLCFTK